ncbi:MAG: hypothetical protein ACYC61_13280 [Isosphaeraceae bacterium]
MWRFSVMAARCRRIRSAPADPRRRRPARPSRALEPLETRSLLSGSVSPLAPVPAQAPIVPAPPQYYPQPRAVSDPGALVSTDPIWQTARAYQFGPDPAQQFWVMLPANPTGQVNLIVHSGGFHKGEVTSGEINPYAHVDLAQGIAVVSIGYRLLGDATWPAPVDDVAVGIDESIPIVQSLIGRPVTDITETGLSAGGTALALINYSPFYPATTVQPNRIITVSAPLERNATTQKHAIDGFRYSSELTWPEPPRSHVPITLMGTPDDPIAQQNSRVSTIGEFSDYLRRYGVRVATYFDHHKPGEHGSITPDLPRYPDVAAAYQRALTFG